MSVFGRKLLIVNTAKQLFGLLKKYPNIKSKLMIFIFEDENHWNKWITNNTDMVYTYSARFGKAIDCLLN